MERMACSTLWESVEWELLGLVFPLSSCVMHVAAGSRDAQIPKQPEV